MKWNKLFTISPGTKDPKNEFDKLKKVIQESLPDRNSTKHMLGLQLGRMESTPSLEYQKAA